MVTVFEKNVFVHLGDAVMDLITCLSDDQIDLDMTEHGKLFSYLFEIIGIMSCSMVPVPEPIVYLLDDFLVFGIIDPYPSLVFSFWKIG